MRCSSASSIYVTANDASTHRAFVQFWTCTFVQFSIETFVQVGESYRTLSTELQMGPSCRYEDSPAEWSRWYAWCRGVRGACSLEGCRIQQAWLVEAMDQSRAVRSAGVSGEAMRRAGLVDSGCRSRHGPSLDDAPAYWARAVSLRRDWTWNGRRCSVLCSRG